MVVDVETQALGDGRLTVFNAAVHEFFDPAAVNTDDVVMVGAMVQLENSHAVFEMMASDEARGFKLREHAIDRGKADVFVAAQELPVDVLRRQVAGVAALQNLQDFEARQRDLQASFAQVLTFHSMFSGDTGGAPGAMRYHLRPLSSIRMISRPVRLV
jgi:hypothetical protein